MQKFYFKDGICRIMSLVNNAGKVVKPKDGRLLLMKWTATNVIDPSKIDNAASPPPTVVISSIKIFDRELPPGDGHLKIIYNENTLTFEFGGSWSFYFSTRITNMLTRCKALIRTGYIVMTGDL
ncbi:MAG: hypothetical protein IPI65_17770 [Bacteroidetes bacterium]|nr:hypothetical protein [Bacteroidota bacterium]